MSSIIPNFEYDIFISYRHKDNKGDHWVTDFVASLKTELESTLKEDISIYFDANPHDGLLETHSVDRSLEEKLKCLIFIPIISQTYCDSKSFAWQHEFCAFNKHAKEDKFARDIKLVNGNVASRILPIKIHDLDVEDETTIENELGGKLRAIEFIFRSAGVNRPLRPNEDHPHENLNKTFYRDQINKVANSIKELTLGIKHLENPASKLLASNAVQAASSVTRKRISVVATLVGLLGLAAYAFFYFGAPGSQLDRTFEKSIAVLPFANMSNDPEQEFFSDGMTDEVLNRLFKLGNLKVISRTSSMKFKGARLTTKEIAQELGVTNVLEGSVQKAGDKIKITVQLIDAVTDNHLWSETYEREFKDIFVIQADIASAVARELNIKLSAATRNAMADVPTQDQLAYEFYLKGEDYWSRSQLNNAISMYSRAIDEDSLFIQALAHRAITHLERYWKKRGEDWQDHLGLASYDLDKLKKLNPDHHELKLAQAYRYYYGFREYDKALALVRELRNQIPNDPLLPGLNGYILRRQGKWKESTDEIKKAITLDPLNADAIFNLGVNYSFPHLHHEALETAKYGLSISPEYVGFKWQILYAELDLGSDFNQAVKESGLTPIELGFYGKYLRKDFEGALKTLDEETSRIESNQSYYGPLSVQYATTFFLRGDAAKVKVYADSSLQFLQMKLTKMKDDFRLYIPLGLCYALLGNESQAIEYGSKALQLMPISLDAMEGSRIERGFGDIYVILGKHDLALEQFEKLLATPSELSIGVLLTDPLYERLRSYPKFKKLVEKYSTNR